MSNILSNTYVLEDTDISNISNFLSENRIPSVNDIRKFSETEIRLWLHYNAVYFLPTKEFVSYITEIIESKCEMNSVIEIGSGVGLLGESLGIRKTDNFMQEWPEIKLVYTLTGQPTIKYGKDVEKLDAIEAIKKYKPHTVIGSYITHKYDPKIGSGNQYGPDPIRIVKNCERYIMIGTKITHKDNPLMKLPHEELESDTLITRGSSLFNRIFIWEKKSIY